MKYASYKKIGKKESHAHTHKNKNCALRVFKKKSKGFQDTSKYRVYVLNDLGQKVREVDENGIEFEIK